MKRFLMPVIMALFAMVWVFGITEARAQENCSATIARIMQSGVLKVGVNPRFKPFSFEEDGKRVGVDVDIATLLAEKMGAKLQIVVPDSFGDLIPMVQSGQIDVVMAGMSITFDRAMAVDFSQPYFNTGLTVLANKGRLGKLGAGQAKDFDSLIEKLNNKGNMSKLVIAVTKGKSPEKAVPQFFPDAQVVQFDTNEAAAEAVLTGKADIMVHDEMFLKVWLHDNAKTAQFVVTVFDRPFKPDNYGFAVAKGNLDFVHMLDTFILAELQGNGRVIEYISNYIPVKAQVSIRSYNITDDVYGGD